jgi:hypothetical protein
MSELANASQGGVPVASASIPPDRHRLKELEPQNAEHDRWRVRALQLIQTE